MAPNDSVRQLQLPSDICEAADRRFGAHFGGLEPFLAYVLKELLRSDTSDLDSAERGIIEARLKDLGYI